MFYCILYYLCVDFYLYFYIVYVLNLLFFYSWIFFFFFFFFQAEDGIRDLYVTGVQTCALPISDRLCRLLDARGAARLGAGAATCLGRRDGTCRTAIWPCRVALDGHARGIPGHLSGSGRPCSHAEPERAADSDRHPPRDGDEHLGRGPARAGRCPAGRDARSRCARPDAPAGGDAASVLTPRARRGLRDPRIGPRPGLRAREIGGQPDPHRLRTRGAGEDAAARGAHRARGVQPPALCPRAEEARRGRRPARRRGPWSQEVVAERGRPAC